MKNKKIEQTEAKAVLEATKDLDLTKVIGEVSGLQVQMQNTLAGLSAALTSKIQQMEQMDTAIALKEQRLQELYGIEDMAVTLDDMKAQRESEERQHKEQEAARSKIWMEQEAERQKKWTREAEEHEYQRKVQETKCKDDFESQVITAKRNEQVRQELLSKGWTERESVIKTKEQEFQNLTKQVADFDSRLKNEVSRAEHIVAANLKKDYDHQIQLLKKDAESQMAVSSMRLSSLEKLNQGLQEQIDNLQLQLAGARADAKEVASEALKSASGRQVAEALQRVVDTQQPTAKNAK